MSQPLIVEMSEVSHVERQEDTPFLYGPRQLRLVSLPEAIRLRRRDGVETPVAKLGSNGTVDILIREESKPGHEAALPLDPLRWTVFSSSAAKSASISSACS